MSELEKAKLAIQVAFENEYTVEQIAKVYAALRESGFDGGITGAILEMQLWLIRAYASKDLGKEVFGFPEKAYHFRQAWFIFICLGLIGFGFDLEQIEQAYLEKNKINHDRQSEGY